MPKGIIYVETMPVSPDREADYHKWYNDTHLAQILRSKGSCPPGGSPRPTGTARSSRSTNSTATTSTRLCGG